MPILPIIRIYEKLEIQSLGSSCTRTQEEAGLNNISCKDLSLNSASLVQRFRENSNIDIIYYADENKQEKTAN